MLPILVTKYWNAGTERNTVCSVCDRRKTMPLCISMRGGGHLSQEIFYKMFLLSVWNVVHGLMISDFQCMVHYGTNITERISERHPRDCWQWLSILQTIITSWHWEFTVRTFSLIMSSTGPQLYSCLSCCCFGLFINATQFFLEDTSMATKRESKQDCLQWLFSSRWAFHREEFWAADPF